jgi:hypothetical protein
MEPEISTTFSKVIVTILKPEKRGPLERPRHRREDNIKIDFREVGWEAWTGSILLRIGTGDGLL